jgi:hypothetical protein
MRRATLAHRHFRDRKAGVRFLRWLMYKPSELV